MADIIQDVKDKMKTIEELRRKQAKQDGQKQQLLKQLEEASGTTSIADAEKKSAELSLELIKHENLLKKLDEEMAAIISAATPEEN